MSAPLTPEERREAVERAAQERIRFGNWLLHAKARDRLTMSIERFEDVVDAHASLGDSFAAALSAVEQERDEQDVQLAEAITAKVEAEREVVRLKAQLAEATRGLEKIRDKTFQGAYARVIASGVLARLAALASVSGADATEEQE